MGFDPETTVDILCSHEIPMISPHDMWGNSKDPHELPQALQISSGVGGMGIISRKEIAAGSGVLPGPLESDSAPVVTSQVMVDVVSHSGP